MTQKKRHSRWIFIWIGVLVCMGLSAGYLLHRHHAAKPATVETAQVHMPENVVCFYQKDDVWKTEHLGESKYTMADSGCLTCCVAAAFQMQEISVDGLAENANAGTVNQFFSEQGVYDGEGNLQWNMLEKSTGVSVVQKDAGELADGELDAILESGSYPIVRVRVGGVGSYHYVLIVGSADGTYQCMDPLEQEEKLVPLSAFGETIYAVRYLQNG